MEFLKEALEESLKKSFRVLDKSPEESVGKYAEKNPAEISDSTPGGI